MNLNEGKIKPFLMQIKPLLIQFILLHCQNNLKEYTYIIGGIEAFYSKYLGFVCFLKKISSGTFIQWGREIEVITRVYTEGTVFMHAAVFSEIIPNIITFLFLLSPKIILK